MHCNNLSKGGKETLYINAHGTGTRQNRGGRLSGHAGGRDLSVLEAAD